MGQHKVLSVEVLTEFENDVSANYKLVADAERRTLGFCDWLNIGGVRMAGQEGDYFAGDLIVDFADDNRGPHGEGGAFVYTEQQGHPHE